MVFRAKDPYQDRPLPYLIGSKEWHEKWHIGLVESDMDDVTDSDNDNDTMKSSSSTNSLSSNVPVSLSESEHVPYAHPNKGFFHSFFFLI